MSRKYNICLLPGLSVCDEAEDVRDKRSAHQRPTKRQIGLCTAMSRKYNMCLLPGLSVCDEAEDVRDKRSAHQRPTKRQIDSCTVTSRKYGMFTRSKRAADFAPSTISCPCCLFIRKPSLCLFSTVNKTHRSCAARPPYSGAECTLCLCIQLATSLASPLESKSSVNVCQLTREAPSRYTASYHQIAIKRELAPQPPVRRQPIIWRLLCSSRPLPPPPCHDRHGRFARLDHVSDTALN
ncbi:hypothetical protein J6590_014581 [Homalodisca vitripennis]|nr:hypothetical protein J6590_014581 [Homalodisca vitripennis]